ncbi:MAG TPA: phosphatidate cytidylyltransferase [Gallionella sp.]|nr:phosphatidate cytidylyltransferase [Gallionella sp.]
MLKTRVLTALILFGLLLVALFVLPTVGWSILVLVVIMQGAVEWARLSGMRGRQASLYWVVILLSMLALLWLDANTTATQQVYFHMPVYLVSALLWLIIAPTWLMIGWKIDQPVLMAATGWAVLVPTGLAMLDLRATPPMPWVLLAVMGLVWVADISAYFAGRRFGTHKLAPEISPGKTWEGVGGAIIGVTIYILLVWRFNPAFLPREALPGLLLASWWWVCLAVIGDLFESAIKRQAGVKDSGALLPGHGGLLDRIDALTSTLPLAALAMLLQKLA